jgi:Uma2 family endonuclease
MSTASRITPRPPLVNGDRMTQAEFHRRYEMYDEDQKWELVGGIVYMASPLGRDHSGYDGKIGLALEIYESETPGVEVLHNATTILGEASEPQPDLAMRVLPEFGGQSRTTEDNYVEGSPELMVEVAHSTRSLALHGKRDDYQRAGAIEYIVVCVEEQQIRWFHFPSGRFIQPDRQGISKSRAFPGLWLDIDSVLRRAGRRVREVVELGLASRAHAAFVRRHQRQHPRRRT